MSSHPARGLRDRTRDDFAKYRRIIISKLIRHAVRESNWDDLIQEILTSAVKDYDPSLGSPTSFVVAVADNHVYNFWRQLRQRGEHASLDAVEEGEDESSIESLVSPQEGPKTRAIMDDIEARARRVYDLLTATDREILALRAENVKLREIAARARISMNAVKASLRRSDKVIHDELHIHLSTFLTTEEDRKRAVELTNLLHKIPAQLKEVFVARHINKQSVAAIALTLQETTPRITQAVVQERLAAAYSALRRVGGPAVWPMLKARYKLETQSQAGGTNGRRRKR